MRILLTNDDGIHAPGLAALENIARKLSDDIWVVAPEQEQSGASHSLTLHVPVRVRPIEKQRFAISGTPTDCVLLASREIIPAFPSPLAGEGKGGGASRKPLPLAPSRKGRGNKGIDLVLSGVNRGSNVGDDITYSGTCAAAMEAALLGIPAFALSQLCFDEKPIHFETAEHFAPGIIRKLLKAGWPKGSFINLNFPACAPKSVKGISVCAQGQRKVSVGMSLRKDPRGRPYYWLGGDRDNATATNTVDVARLDAGHITVTPIQMDMTDHKTLKQMQVLYSD